MSSRNHWAAGGLAALLLLAPAAHADEDPAQRQSIEELRNTVINLLQALVDKGLLTREQAQQLVKQATDKAAADAAALAAKNAAQAKEEENAVRVPYVPEIVKEEITKQVEQDVKPAVVADVVDEAKKEKWGIPGALPEWLSRVKVFGDVTVREQSDMFAKDNGQVPDFNAINAAGGAILAQYPYLDTSEDRNRLRLRARLGVEGDISPYITAFIRIASGSITNAASESQTFGTYGERYNVGLDQAYIRWNTNTLDKLSFSTANFGRMPNPWFSPTELVYARDLTFEGVSDTLRVGWGGGDADKSHLYLTLGAFPMLEVPLSNQNNKWLVGGQFGTNLRFNDGSDHLRVGLAYYDFLHVTGVMNSASAPGLTNYTAPAYVQSGNTMFNIDNNVQSYTGQQLWALASHFRVVDAAANFEHNFTPNYSLAVTGEAVRNLGFNMTQIEALTIQPIAGNENHGYVGEVSFGTPVVDHLGAWRAAVGYRYVQSDAVIDAWTDADFHEGGTNTLGYYFWTSFGVAKNTWVRARYMSGNEITGPRYGLDILQVDLNARF